MYRWNAVYGTAVNGLRGFGGSAATGERICILDVCGGAGESPGPEYELCGESGIVGPNLLCGRDYGSGVKRGSGPGFHVRLGTGAGGRRRVPGYHSFAVCHLFDPGLVLSVRPFHDQDQTRLF